MDTTLFACAVSESGATGEGIVYQLAPWKIPKEGPRDGIKGRLLPNLRVEGPEGAKPSDDGIGVVATIDGVQQRLTLNQVAALARAGRRGFRVAESGETS